MKKTIITIISLLVVLLVFLYGYEFVFKKPIIESPTISKDTDLYVPTTELKEQYKDSVYTFVGNIQVPTPCHTIQSKVNVIADSTYQIEVITVPPVAGTICAEVITNKTYKVSFEAGKNITVTSRINGIEYKTNRFVIPLDKNIDTFNLEIKG